MAAAVAATPLVLFRSDHTVACGRAADVFHSRWTTDRQKAIASAFAAARPYGGATAQQAIAALDAYGARWKVTRIDACKATHERGEQSDQVLDRRSACLDRARTEFDALVSVFAAADGTTTDRALAAIDALPAPEACDATVADTLPLPADPRTRAVETELAAAKAARSAGDLETARRHADAALMGAQALGHPGLLADARTVAAWLTKTTDAAGARSALEKALGEAVRAHDPELEARAGIDLLAMANDSGDTTWIESLLPMVRPSVDRISATSPLHVSFLRQYYWSLHTLGRFDDAFAVCADLEAIEPAPKYLGDECRCTTAIAAMRNDDASKYCRAALTSSEARHGADHAVIGQSLNYLAIVENRLGHYDAALPLRERVLHIVEAAHGPDSESTAAALHNLGVLLLNMGRLEEARTHLERARAIRARDAKGARDLAQTHSVLGAVLARLGDTEGALHEADEALHATEAAVGPEHPELAIALLNHGQTYSLADRCDVALASYDRGEALATSKLGATHLVRGALLLGKAECLRAMRRAREAIAAAEGALRIMEHAATTPKNVGAAHAALGNALLDDHQVARARTELEKARSIFAAMGEPARHLLEETDRALKKASRLR
jgi:tetratricopeptide (TPR) repeat protein